jgi:hypothetical protein
MYLISRRDDDTRSSCGSVPLASSFGALVYKQAVIRTACSSPPKNICGSREYCVSTSHNAINSASGTIVHPAFTMFLRVRFLAARVGPFARDSERFVIRLLIGGTEKPR